MGSIPRMGVLRRVALGSLVSLWQWFFPPTTEIPPSMRPQLERCFPNVDLDRVHVHERVPLLIRFSWPDAMTLPGAADTSTIHVYLRPRLLEEPDCETLAYLAHEFVHVQQYLAYAGGYGIGLYRAFWYLYLTCALRFGYTQNPLEDEAERVEHAIAERCTTTDSGDIGLCCDDVVFCGTDIGFLDQFGRAVPGLQRLWAVIEGLLDISRAWAGHDHGGRSGDRNRGLALLTGPLLVMLAGILSALGVAYAVLFGAAFGLITSLALTAWYVARALYVAMVAAWGAVCLPILGLDTLFAQLRRLE